MISEVLMIDVITGNIGIMQSLITRMEILALPSALLFGIADIILSVIKFIN